MDSTGFRPTPRFREKRRPLLKKLELYNARDERLDIMVRDISPHGFSAAARSATPSIDEVVTVALPDGQRLWGIVRWAEGNLFGVEFDANPEPGHQPKLAGP